MSNQVLENCVIRLLTPFVRVILRYGMPFGSFAELAKRVYVDVAMKNLAIPDKKPTVSRASVITGLSRKEVLRIQRLPDIFDELAEDRATKSYNRAIRVISGWVRDEKYSKAAGQPAVLPFDDGDRSFSELVHRYSGDVTPRAILDELERVGSVEILEGGEVQLLSTAYVPREGEDEKIAILGNDVADLINTIDHNLQAKARRTRLQLKVSYDDLPREGVVPFRTLSSKESRKLIDYFDRKLLAIDRESNPSSKGTGRIRAGVAIYYFEEDLYDEIDEGE